MSEHALCVVCGAPVAEDRLSLLGWAAPVQGRPEDALPLCLLVLLKVGVAWRGVAWGGVVWGGVWCVGVCRG